MADDEGGYTCKKGCAYKYMYSYIQTCMEHSIKQSLFFFSGRDRELFEQDFQKAWLYELNIYIGLHTYAFTYIYYIYIVYTYMVDFTPNSICKLEMTCFFIVSYMHNIQFKTILP